MSNINDNRESFDSDEQIIHCKRCGQEYPDYFSKCPYCEGEKRKSKQKRKNFFSTLLLGIAVFFLLDRFGIISVPVKKTNPVYTPQYNSSINNPTPLRNNSYTIPSTNVYKDNQCTLTFSNLSNNKSVDYSFTNNGSSDMYCYIAGISVNGCMTYDYTFNSLATPGNTLKGTFYFNDLDVYGIKDIISLDVCFAVEDNAVFSSFEHYLIKTNCNSSISYSAGGKRVIFEDDNISVYLDAKGEDFDSINLIYYNKTNELLDCYATDCALNGTMISSPIWGPGIIAPHSYAHTAVGNGTISLYNPIMDEINNIKTPITQITGKICYSFNNEYSLHSSDNLSILDKQH